MRKPKQPFAKNFAAGVRALMVALVLTSGVPALAGTPPITGDVRNFTPTVPVKPVPNITFIDGVGAQGSLNDYAGKVIVLNIWATWCPPCVQELPSLDRLSAQIAGDDAVVLTISVDHEGRDKVQPFFAQRHLTHLPIALDPRGQVMRVLGVHALPATIIINRDGDEVGRAYGGTRWDGPDALALLQFYLKQPRPGGGLTPIGYP